MNDELLQPEANIIDDTLDGITGVLGDFDGVINNPDRDLGGVTHTIDPNSILLVIGGIALLLFGRKFF